MIKVGICEDDKISRETIGRMLRQYFMGRGMEYQQKEYDCGRAFIESGEDTDILILDIEMEGISGIQLKDWLWEEDEEVKILFITNHMEDMLEAFGKNVYGFLHKPVKQAQLEKYLNQMIEDIEENLSLLVKGFKQEFVIQTKNIFYFVSENKYSHVVSKDGKYFCDKGLGQWEKELGNHSFYRCHKCYLVNFQNICKIGESIYMENGDTVPVSRRKRRKLKESYLDYIIRKAR